MLLKILTILLPWQLRYRALNRWFHYEIHPSARIGLAWVFPKKLIMESNTTIEHLTVGIHLDTIRMDSNSYIGRSNWITGFPTNSQSLHFAHQTDRRSELHLCASASVTKHHHFDCTSLIRIGHFATIAGYDSQLLTHSINLIENRQDSSPIYIGNYTFVGTNSVILGGSSLPNYSILGAKSLLNKFFSDEWFLYGGVPAKPLQEINRSAKYFTRTENFVI